ncbi:MAG: hypothetical protein ACYSU6_03185, partial [Planctomycetota bacterium]
MQPDVRTPPALPTPCFALMLTDRAKAHRVAAALSLAIMAWMPPVPDRLEHYLAARMRIPLSYGRIAATTLHLPALQNR